MSLSFAVLGDPVRQSLSPVLHSAVFTELGLDWTYNAVEVPAGFLSAYLDGPGASLLGASVTMPLKPELAVLGEPLASSVAGADAVLTGVANTFVRAEAGLELENTDVAGFAWVLARHGVGEQHAVGVLGSGATARSAVLALVRAGVRSIRVLTRSEPSAEFKDFLDRAGAKDLVSFSLFGDAFGDAGATPEMKFDVLISTVPANADLDWSAVGASQLVLEAAYGAEPTILEREVAAAGGTYISGRELLVAQAVPQSLRFLERGGVFGDEQRIRRVMRDALQLPPL